MPPLPGTFDSGPDPGWDPSQGISLSVVEKGGDPFAKATPQVLIPQHQTQQTSAHAAPPISRGLHAEEAPSTKRLRPLTVNEALPYTPFSSIVPFDPANFVNPYPLFASADDRSKGQEYLRHLDKAAKKGDRPTEVEHAVEKIRDLINAEKNAGFELIFKRPASGKTKHNLNPGRRLNVKGLGAFAGQVMNAVQPVYRYPGANEQTRSSKPKNASAKTPVTPSAKGPIAPKQIQDNRDAFAQNAQVIVKNGYGKDSVSPSELMLHQPKVEVALVAHPDQLSLTSGVMIQAPTMSNDTTQYRIYNEEAQSLNGRPLKREYDEMDDDDEKIPTLDQRAVGDTNVRQLAAALTDVVEAEETLRLNGSHPAYDHYFVPVEGADGEQRLTLSSALQVKLDGHLQKVIGSGRLNDVSIDDLVQLQKLCEPALSTVDSVDVQIKAGWSEDEISAWLDRIHGADLIIRSARTILRTMTGGRTEKQLYSEEMLQNVIKLLSIMTDTCLVPMVEARTNDDQSSIYNVATTNKKVMNQLLHDAGKIMHLLFDLLVKQDFSEQPVTNLEFFVIRLLFVENSPTEKESILGIAKFEMYRRSAMNVLATIFSKYPDQRQFIISEVLSSLQKLPTGKLQARQYRLSDGTRMQLVSVLLIRLVQTSGVRVTAGIDRDIDRTMGGADDDSGDSSNEDEDHKAQETKADEPATNGETAAEEVDGNTVPPPLIRNARALYESAGRSASQITNFLVNRAQTATKSGDQPHRHLLDMFVEDLIAVMQFPDWPAAELLLRALLLKMIEILNDNKSSAPAKNMALETLGYMGTAITNTWDAARGLALSLENTPSSIGDQLQQYWEDHNSGDLDLLSLIGWRGPYRMVLEYLEANSADPQAPSAKAFYLTQWTKLALWGHKNASKEMDKTILGSSSLALRLAKLTYSGQWSPEEDFEPVSTPQSKLAYLLIMLNNHFCKNFNRILQYLVQSCSSDQPRVRTRSLKSVTQMIEKDHSLLERIPQLKGLMRNCVVDSSTNVRDNALLLIARCIESKPSLEMEWVGPVLQCSRDSVVGIRKRAIRLLRDTYLRQVKKEENTSTDLRGVVAKGLLQCVEDLDEGTADLAKQIMEEIWLAPFVNLVTDETSSAQHRVALATQMSLIIETVQRETAQRDTKLSELLEKFLRFAMSSKSKASEANARICKAFVSLGFEGIIDSTELPNQPEQRIILQCLVSFAHANPKLFTQQQLSHLKPYIKDLTSSEDVLLFKSIVMIYRSVLPILPSVQKDFLKAVQEDLLKNVTKLGRPELNEAAACLWTINTVLENVERLVNLVLSVLKKLHGLEGQKIPSVDLTPQQQQAMSTIQRLILIAGCFGQHCNFQGQINKFKAATPWLRGDMVAGKIVSAIKAFTRSELPMSLRQTAFDGMGMVCQKWPLVFTQTEIARIFQQVLRSPDINLQKIILSSFRDFFATQDQFSLGPPPKDQEAPTGGKLGASLTANEHDSAASLISQGFLRDVVRIAVNSIDENALTATEVMASITRQGLVHPKECGPALVALETSPNARIAEIAYQQHYNLHQQHESMFEREYMRAIHEAFKYQRDVVKDPKGYTLPNYKAKLHSMYEVVKTSKSKYQGKFLDYYTQKVNFELSSLDVDAEMPEHLLYSRFLIENLAFFEFGRIQDAVQALTCMERIVQGNGAGISHSVNTEIFNLKLDPETGAPMQATDGGAATVDISSRRLRLLTVASMILTMLWDARTFMRQLWGISNQDIRRQGKARPSGTASGTGTPSKDTNRAPTKNSSITGERLATSIGVIWGALESREASLAQCKRFTDMMTVDSELKVGADSGAEDFDGYDTPGGGYDDGDDDSVIPPSGGSRVKRRGSASLAGTPSKKKQRVRVPGVKNRFKGGMDGADDEDADGDADFDGF